MGTEHQTSKITVILIQGFLGSGKTTFIQQIIPFFVNEAVGIIENEVGEVSIDAEILGQDSIELREINNGAIFCACQSHNFIHALEKFAEKKIDVLIIEASGIGDPSPMKNNIEFANQRCNDRFDYRGSICVVDSSEIADLMEVVPVVSKQIQNASLVLLNKTDLAQTEQITEIQKYIKEINAQAPIVLTTQAQITESALNKIMLAPSIPIAGESINTAQKRPQEITLTTGKVMKRENLDEMLTHMAPYTYRIKGIMKTINPDQKKENLLISAVHNQINLTKWPKPILESNLVVIFKANPAIESIVREAWRAYI